MHPGLVTASPAQGDHEEYDLDEEWEKLGPDDPEEVVKERHQQWIASLPERPQRREWLYTVVPYDDYGNLAGIDPGYRANPVPRVRPRAPRSRRRTTRSSSNARSSDPDLPHQLSAALPVGGVA